ncbi:MAG: PQQ-dependent sugar dehydrogenase, partial [Anaerolineae bacterium]|nr:PQQ-dependent sugar dehydrogenase [Anaerolineae bacterium]
VEHVGRFPGQPQQITYGPDGRLYATVLENGATRIGAVYVLNPDGSSERYSGDLISPIGLAFQPGTDVLYVSARMTLNAGGGVWRIPSGGGDAVPVIEDLPCCYSLIDNQPNGLIFGPDGYLYLGIGALTDHAEPPFPERMRMAEIGPLEAAILRIQPHTGEVEPFASGLHNPYDLTFDASGQFYATDQGLVSGQGDRVLRIEPGGNYGWPYWAGRGCDECPFGGSSDILPDLLTFADFSVPRGLVAYTGTQYPANLFNHLFVVLWNGIEGGQRVVQFDPANPPQPPDEFTPAQAEPFITGLIRPIDITLAPDGTLVVADFIYGHVWKVRYDA